MDETLNRDVNELDRVRSEAGAALKHMRSELARLERRRKDAVDLVMSDNNNQSARAQMEDTEAKIEALKKRIGDFRKESFDQLHLIRDRIEARRDTLVEEVQRELAETRARQEALQSDLIPSAKAALDRYQEEKKELDAKCLTLMSRVNEMRQTEFHSDLLEID